MIKSINFLTEIGLDENSFPIFFSKKWLGLKKNTNAVVLFFYDESGQIIVPIIIYKLRIINKAEYLYCPLTFSGNDISENIEFDFLNKLHIYFKKNKICDIILPPSTYVTFKSIPKNVYYYEMGIIHLNLTKSDDKIFNDFSANYRNEIKKCINVGLEKSFDLNNLNQYYEMYRSTYERQQMTYSEISKFNDIKNNFPNQTLIGISKYNGENQTGVLVYFDRKFAYYDSAGSSNNNKIPGANKALLFDIMLLLKKKGIEKFILGGYENSESVDKKSYGIQKFKLRFGSEIENGFHFIKIINPLKYRLFSFALFIKSILLRKKLSLFYSKKIELRKSND
jgi:lipid II:glycine glycyltransferase (peptidoglycan interpeptide bridge formation enzyme)